MKSQNPSMHGSKDMACVVFHSDLFSKGHNSRKGDKSDTKTNVRQLILHEGSIYEISKPSMHGS